MLTAKVIVNLSIDRHFDYIVPDELVGKLRPGVQVLVPFRNSLRNAYVLALSNDTSCDPSKLKTISAICEKHPEIPDNLLKLAKWISEYYCCAQEQAVKALLPLAVRSGKVARKESRHLTLKSLDDAHKFLLENGKKSKSRALVVQYLIDHPGASVESISEATGAGKAPISALLKCGLLEEEKKASYKRFVFDSASLLPSQPPELNDEQAEAARIIEALFERAEGQKTLLLHGVTGSGKTEVYMRAIETALKKNLEAIVLVPEIALTPQTTERFISRFRSGVSVLHSGLSDGERYDEWMKIYHGLVKIAIGARSAIFAPFRNLGLIVVDEEHEPSYKQEEAPRYNARDLAVMRGVMENSLVILGSATPSFESYANACSGRYAIARLKKRIDSRPMPSMIPIDMNIERVSDSEGRLPIFSKPLLDAIAQRLQRAEQSIIFLNRRGFASQMSCPDCGFVAQCSDCSISYTYHRTNECLACHMCGAVLRAYAMCPSCGSDKIRYKGLGTEKIEALLSMIFPLAKVARMDADTMSGRRKNYEKLLGDFGAGKIDILVGTQMIAKGLDFPNVTLVGIVSADRSLFIPDFRAAERTFQLLTQVSGRCGRGSCPGEVYIQTSYPENPAIISAIRHDFEAFFKSECVARKEFNYPPSCHLTAIHFKGSDAAALEKYSLEFLDSFKSKIPDGIFVSDPAPAPIEKIKTKFRYMILFRGNLNKDFRCLIREKIFKVRHPSGIEIYADVDAINLT